MTREVWARGDAYEAYVGRWSRRVAAQFVRWLDVPAGRRWLDVGCGTGALSATVLTLTDPAEVTGVDPSDGFLATAHAQVADPRVSLMAGDARALPLPPARFDAVVSGLALNFVPEPAQAAAECARVAAPGAVVAAYVWDYAEGMELMRQFWDAAAALDAASVELDEGAASRSADRARCGHCGRTRVWLTCPSRQSTSRRCSSASRTTGSRSWAGRGPRPRTRCRSARSAAPRCATCCATAYRPTRTVPSCSPPARGRSAVTSPPPDRSLSPPPSWPVGVPALSPSATPLLVGWCYASLVAQRRARLVGRFST
ncbi:methyltransferase domain-containing protein [Phytohabitans flavus]|uniref:class I SAM-dependent methyltransferase n=1 Tax=Phytohabitans flavus TaxID=1076124 RepID=UPI00363FAE3A